MRMFFVDLKLEYDVIYIMLQQKHIKTCWFKPLLTQYMRLELFKILHFMYLELSELVGSREY